MSDDDTLPIDWTLTVEAVPERGGAVTLVATEAERGRVAAALGLLSLSDLRLSCRIDRLAGARYRMRGVVSADLAQACVVSLDPVPARLDEPVDVEFQPGSPAAEAKDVVVALDEASDIETIERGRLELGRVVYETLSAGLDPYPRRPGEGFDEMLAAPKGADTSKANPFAVLAKLKPKSG